MEAIRLEQNSFRIKQLERATTQVISWWWEYQRNEYDSTLISFWVENDGSEIHIRGTQPGTTYPSIKDQYNQTATIEVIVEDLNLELVKYEFQLNPGQEEIVYFMEYYSDIVSLVKNNENAKIYLDQDEQGKYLRIEWIEEWITIFQVTDVEWNSKTGKITVWPGSVTEPENPGEPVEPEPNPEEESPEEKELREFLEELQNLSNGVQVNALTEEQQVSLEEYKIIVDAIISKFKAKNFSDVRISAAITAVQNVKEIISAGTSSKKELYVEVLGYLINWFNILLTNDIQVEYFIKEVWLDRVSWIQFKITWKVDEVWVEYETLDWTIERKVLSIQEDWEYIVAFTKESCWECNNFKPYYTVWSKTEYYEQPLIAHYSNTIWLASNEGVEINSYNGFSRFQSILNFAFYKEWYAEASQKVIDFKREYEDQISLGVSIIPLVWEWYDVWTLLGTIDPITREQLDHLDLFLTAIWLLTWVWSWKLARDLFDAWIKKISDHLGIAVSELKAIALQVASEYKITSLEDLQKLKGRFTVEGFLKTVKLKAWWIKSNKIIDDLDYSKIEELRNGIAQMTERLWTRWDIANIIKNPKKIGKSINEYNGTSNTATVFYNSNYEYIIVDDITWKVFHISDKNNLSWIPDDRIYNLTDF